MSLDRMGASQRHTLRKPARLVAARKHVACLCMCAYQVAVQVQSLAMAAGAMKAVPLAVSGAFHTPLMQPAREALIQA